ncbi:MAG: histidine kinase [Chitinophagales bacterium]|nr:histidine kinase [Chitinophagales bacterium]
MKFKTRYRFWHVLLGFTCFAILAAIIYYATKDSASSSEATKLKPKAEPFPGSSLMAPLGFIYFVVFFYFTLNYYYNLITANKKYLSYLKISGLIVLVSFLYNSILFTWLPGALINQYRSLWHMFFTMVGNMIPMLLFSYLFAYVTVLREALKQKRILEAQKLLLEAQISQANFNFLKSQINPHFLHNTLNFLYAKSLPFSSELSEGILTLSDIMRYALSQGNQKDGKALLKDEIEHVHNVIRINQLRYNNQLKVNFEMTGTLNGAMIIPFVLITLVENAFKHGDLKNQEYPIAIKVNIQGSKLYFYCRNKKRTGPVQLSTGIGLENIKKRLDLAYGDNYKFIVTDEPEFYTTELTIDKL